MIQQEPYTMKAAVTSMVDVSGRSIVRLSGKDAQDLLHRLSTNDLSMLQTGGSRQTVLTSEKGRIVDVVSVLKISEEALLLVGQTTGGESLRQWLERYIIMEEARVENVTNTYTHLLLFSANPQNNAYGFPFSANTFAVLNQPTLHTLAFAEQWRGMKLQHILCAVESQKALYHLLKEQGVVTSEMSDFELFRISHGIPAHPNELSIEYNPMEAGLVDMISFTKGCYIGQEVIVRLDTYKKVQKRLVRLQLGARPSTLPQQLYSNGLLVGTITSAVYSPLDHNVLAIGYIRTTYDGKQPLYYLIENKQISVLLTD